MYTPVYDLVIHTQDGGCSGLCTHLYTTWSYTHRMVVVVGYVHTCIQPGHTHRMVVVGGYVHTCIQPGHTHTGWWL